MNIKSLVIKEGIERLGGVRKEEFITTAGQRANRKVELDVLNEQKNLNRLLRQMVIGDLATKLTNYEPDLIVPIPKGANHLGKGLAQRLYLPVGYLDWKDKTPGAKDIQPRTEHDRELIQAAGKIALIDDVLTSGSSLLAVCQMNEMVESDIVAAVVWDRSDGSYKDALPFPIESIIQEHIPLWIED